MLSFTISLENRGHLKFDAKEEEHVEYIIRHMAVSVHSISRGYNGK